MTVRETGTCVGGGVATVGAVQDAKSAQIIATIAKRQELQWRPMKKYGSFGLSCCRTESDACQFAGAGSLSACLHTSVSEWGIIDSLVAGHERAIEKVEKIALPSQIFDAAA
jgi:hypothetical protein